MKQRVIILKGLPASGKTTWAKNFCKDDEDFVRVNRDDLRHMCGTYWVPKREGLITDMERFAVESALKRGYNVIVDATNLNPKYSGWIGKIAEEYDAVTEEMFFNTPVEECIRRDEARENPVGKAVIMRMFNQLPN